MRRDGKKTWDVFFPLFFFEAAKVCKIMSLTAECLWHYSRGNLTEQFNSIWMKFNPHSSPSALCSLMCSKVRLVETSEEAPKTNVKTANVFVATQPGWYSGYTASSFDLSAIRYRVHSPL